MNPALTPDEVYDITKPLKQPAAQVRYLRKIGIRAERRPDGTVLVLRVWLATPAGTIAQSRPLLRSDRSAHYGQAA